MTCSSSTTSTPDRRIWLGATILALLGAAPVHGAGGNDALASLRATALQQREQGDLAEAGHTLDRAIEIAPNDPELWVDIGRLRYAGGEHTKAIEAAEHAVALGPHNVRALEFRGQIVRDQFGLKASLPWFEAALDADPKDASVLGEYAATLGDLGEAKAMLAVSRRLMAVSPGNPRALFLQSVLAARADKIDLARSLLDRVNGPQANAPATLLLSGVLQLRAGNYALARAPLERLVQTQPANGVAQDLLAKATYLAGDYKAVIERFGPAAQRADASAYLLTLVARSYEELGQRELAAPLLDRASAPAAGALMAVPESQLGDLIANGRFDAADEMTRTNLDANPGSAIFQVQAADAATAHGRLGEALDHYRAGARIRMSTGLVQRCAIALLGAGRANDAYTLVNGWIAQNPATPGAIRLAADFGTRADADERQRRVVLLDYLRQQGGERDLGLLIDLANARMDAGDAPAAVEAAATAYRLQRSSLMATHAYAQALRQQDARSPLAVALEAKLTGMSPR